MMQQQEKTKIEYIGSIDSLNNGWAENEEDDHSYLFIKKQGNTYRVWWTYRDYDFPEKGDITEPVPCFKPAKSKAEAIYMIEERWSGKLDSDLVWY